VLAGVVALAFVSGAGCYSPTIGDKFKCNFQYEPGAGQCPDGFHCDGVLCVSGPEKTGTGGSGGNDGSVDKAAPPLDAPVEMTTDVPSESPPAEVAPDEPPMCIMPVAGCVQDTSKLCDPVCQKGCSCTQKCSANSAGTYTCNAPLNLRPKALGEGCNPSSTGTTAQTDDCAPGLVCLTDGCGNRCYKFCKSDNDCSLATCAFNAGGGVKVCNVPAATCNPVSNGMASGCPGNTQVCYLDPTTTDRTFCNCPVGAGMANSSCTLPTDCFPGLVCVDANGTGNSICRPVCDLANGSSDCLGQTCMPVKSSKKFGFCN
jgi:hypothetical protein